MTPLYTAMFMLLAVATTACAHPLHTSPLHLARESPFVAVTVHDCYDGDTCTVTLHDEFLPAVFKDRIHVRLVGIDTPERHGACALERARAFEARSYLQSVLSRAVRIDLVDPQRDKYFRLLAHLVADGQDLSQSLLNAHLAVAYNGGTKTSQWCE